jgi:hypothetical protein
VCVRESVRESVCVPNVCLFVGQGVVCARDHHRWVVTAAVLGGGNGVAECGARRGVLGKKSVKNKDGRAELILIQVQRWYQ